MTIEQNARTVRDHYRKFWAAHGRTTSGMLAAREPPIMNIGYWGNGAATSREAQVEFVRVLASNVPNIEGSRILDAGCGVGGPATILAAEYGARVEGITIIEEHVSLARSYLQARQLDDKVSIHTANAMDLPFEDDSFDVVFCLEAAHCFVDKPCFLREVGRVLRPGGTLVMADITATVDLPVVRWQPALKLNLVTPERWRSMIDATSLRVTRHERVGRAVYPGFRRWIAHTAPDRRRQILKSLSGADIPVVRDLRRAQAWILEFVLNRSVLPLSSALRLRDYVLIVAQKPDRLTT
jgi:ubiquinone/menaquinone biosynthesis C-methylase UbiE